MVTIPWWLVRYGFPAACLAAVTAIVVLGRPALHDDPTTARARVAAPPVRRAPPPTPQVRSSRATAYSVRSGDTLEVIAERFGTSVERLLELNPGIDPNALRVGQVLRVD
jgi:nucleoid-associated protein YgaU